MKNNKGLSIIELILFILIMGLAVPPLFIMGANLYEQSINVETLHVATDLAIGKMEEVKSSDFASLASRPVTAFPGQFNRYQYWVAVNYVSPSNLDTPVDPTVTHFKRVSVSVQESTVLARTVTFTTVVTDE